MVRFSRLAVAIAFVLALAACGGTAVGSGPADPGFAGHWTSRQWGEHYIRVDGTTVKIIYAHDDGRVLGTLSGLKVTGWWTEVPSRLPPKDAGDVTFTLTTGTGPRTIDGVWRYSAEGPTLENWDLTWVDDEIPADVAAKFADDAAFLRHP